MWVQKGKVDAAFEGGVKAFVGAAYFDELFERVEIDLVIDGDFPLFALDVVVVDGAVLATHSATRRRMISVSGKFRGDARSKKGGSLALTFK